MSTDKQHYRARDLCAELEEQGLADLVSTDLMCVMAQKGLKLVRDRKQLVMRAVEEHIADLEGELA